MHHYTSQDAIAWITARLQYLSTPKETERLLGVSSATLRKMGNNGEIEFITLSGGHRRYDARGYMENGPRKPSPKQEKTSEANV